MTSPVNESRLPPLRNPTRSSIPWCSATFFFRPSEGRSFRPSEGKRRAPNTKKTPFRVTHAGKQARVELNPPIWEEITWYELVRTIKPTRKMLADRWSNNPSRFDKNIQLGETTSA